VRRLTHPKLFWLRLTLAGLALAVFESWQIGRPSLWADEVATVAAANRPIGALLHMLTTIDAVHGSYYLLIHALGHLIGFSPFSLRLPSALAVAATAVMIALIARKISGERLAWFALVISAVLPRLVWAATEARSYGIDALLTTVMLWLFLTLLDPNRTKSRWLWVAYTAVVALDTHFFVYSILVSGTQGLWLLLRQRKHAGLHIFRRWLLAQGIALGVSGYLITWVLMEQGQVGWLPAIGQTTVEEVFVGQAFWGNPTLAYLATGLLIAVFAGAKHAKAAATGLSSEILEILGLAIVIPPALVLIYSVSSHPIYDARYFTITAPMVALALAIALDRLFARPLAPVALLLLVAVALPTYGRFRSIDAKGTHWTQVAETLGAMGKAGDGVLFTDYDRKSPSQSRVMIGYASIVGPLTDLTAVVPYQKSPGLYPKRVPAAKVAGRIAQMNRVLVVAESTEKPEYRKLYNQLTDEGFAFSIRHRVAHTWINVFSKR